MAFAKTKEGAFLHAFRHEMESTMNDNPKYSFLSMTPELPMQPAERVKNAKAALKHAKALAKTERKQAKAARRAQRQEEADYALAFNTLREICEDDRKYSADARVVAAKELLARVA